MKKTMKFTVVLISVIFVFLVFSTVGCRKPVPANQETKEETGEQKKDQNKDVKPGESGEKVTSKDNDKEKRPGKETAADTESDAVPVQVIIPNRGDISSFLLFSSNVDSEKMVDIYPMTTGIVEKINFDEGDAVNKGDVLAILDDREATINESKARINYEQLKTEFDRQEEIFKKDLISKEDYEKLKYRMDNALLEWKQAQLLLSYTRITTPISGVVSKRYFKTGNKITAAQMAFSVVNVKEKIAVVNIPAQERDNLFLAQKSLVQTGEIEVPGVVKRISPAIDPESGTFKVTVEIHDVKNTLAVGQFVNVQIIKKVHKNVILLSKDALVYDGGKIFVFVVDKDNKAMKKMIKTGFEDGVQVEVLEGLEDQERVVTAGKSSLKNNTQVKIIEPVIS